LNIFISLLRIIFNFGITMTDEYYMMQALREARKALGEDEIPVGALVVINERVIARGYNMVEKLNDPTAHAEMIALTSAFHSLGGKYVPEATLYVTVEPCLMCAGALYWSKIGKIVYGADDEKNGYKKTTGSAWPFHPKTELIRGVLKEECAKLMKDFFKNKR
jgi:tRNA(adenine34) deaminase